MNDEVTLFLILKIEIEIEIKVKQQNDNKQDSTNASRLGGSYGEQDEGYVKVKADETR